MGLKRKNNRKYNYYAVFDDTNNQLSFSIFKTFREAKKYAFEWLKGSGSTVEIVGYTKKVISVVARCEGF